MKEDIRFGYTVRGEYLRPLNEYSYRDSTDHIVIHCSATPPTFTGGAEDIREWHVRDRGFIDIGYHFVITRDGVIERGRPPMAVAAGEPRHGMNRRALHICLVGGVDNNLRPAENFLPAQWRSLNFLVHEAVKAYRIPHANIVGHRDIPGVRKDCPSFDVRRWWGSTQGPELGLPVDGETAGDLFN